MAGSGLLDEDTREIYQLHERLREFFFEWFVYFVLR